MATLIFFGYWFGFVLLVFRSWLVVSLMMPGSFFRSGFTCRWAMTMVALRRIWFRFGWWWWRWRRDWRRRLLRGAHGTTFRPVTLSCHLHSECVSQAKNSDVTKWLFRNLYACSWLIFRRKATTQEIRLSLESTPFTTRSDSCKPKVTVETDLMRFLPKAYPWCTYPLPLVILALHTQRDVFQRLRQFTRPHTTVTVIVMMRPQSRDVNQDKQNHQRYGRGKCDSKQQ